MHATTVSTSISMSNGFRTVPATTSDESERGSEPAVSTMTTGRSVLGSFSIGVLAIRTAAPDDPVPQHAAATTPAARGS